MSGKLVLILPICIVDNGVDSLILPICIVDNGTDPLILPICIVDNGKPVLILPICIVDNGVESLILPVCVVDNGVDSATMVFDDVSIDVTVDEDASKKMCICIEFEHNRYIHALVVVMFVAELIKISQI